MIEAAWYTKEENAAVKCGLCPHACSLSEAAVGICGARININGTLLAATYGQISSAAVDPIEKKPLYHFFPGSEIFSIGGTGCNLKCQFCQNSSIAHGHPATKELPPSKLIAAMPSFDEGNIGVAFTYNEPVIWYEYIRDCAPLVRESGGRVVLITNGYISPEPFAEIAPMIDAMNIDLKAFDDLFYRRYCGGYLRHAMSTIEKAVEAGIHLEITLLLIEGVNDTYESIDAQAKWIASISRDIPFHISRYRPAYKFDLPTTSIDVMKEAWEIATTHLRFVYLGNVISHRHNATVCPSCGGTVIIRSGWDIDRTGLDGTQCAHCRTSLPFVVE